MESGKKCFTQFNMTVPPVEPNHLARLKEVNEKLDKSQGVGNAGKVFQVGNDGTVLLTDCPTAEDIENMIKSREF